jgi:hypothetical protein
LCGIFFAKSWQRRFSRNRPPPRIRREKTSPCRNENYAAFSLPHDLPVQLMSGAARFGEPATSVSRDLRFHIALRAVIRRIGPGMLRKCFNQQRIFGATRCLTAPCSLSTCSGAVFRKHRRA